MPLDPIIAEGLTDRSRQRTLSALGVFCGIAAALWLAAAEAPTKLVTIAVSPLIISFMMVLGAFISRWSLPALIRGTSDIGRDVRQAPHLVVWGVLAGCLWAVGNTLTIFGVRDIGLSIAFPLWNSNSLIGIVWGILFFRELRRAGWLRWVGVVGGAVIIFGGALLLSLASTSQSSSSHPLRGVTAALGAGLMFGSMYIPYRKAYISGMNPLSFITFFTFGEMGTITVLTLTFLGGVTPVWQELVRSRGILFWPLLGGFMWVIGDLFQNFAAKYVGISRGIPLSNTNQLWGLLWGILVFGEFAWGAARNRGEGSRRLPADGGWGRGHCFFLRHGGRIQKLERSGTARERPLRHRSGLCGHQHGRQGEKRNPIPAHLAGLVTGRCRYVHLHRFRDVGGHPENGNQLDLAGGAYFRHARRSCRLRHHIVAHHRL